MKIKFNKPDLKFFTLLNSRKTDLLSELPLQYLFNK